MLMSNDYYLRRVVDNFFVTERTDLEIHRRMRAPYATSKARNSPVCTRCYTKEPTNQEPTHLLVILQPEKGPRMPPQLPRVLWTAAELSV